jgi:23S rRNA maturation mini-RNase III
MSINDYKTELKNMIDATDDEALLKHWKTHLEWEFDQYRQRTENARSNAQAGSATENQDDDDTTGYVTLESGLGINE